MATPIGTATLTAMSRRHIRPWLIDAFYRSNVLFYRWYRSQKVVVRGGTQVEYMIQYQDFSNTAWYQGFDLFDTTPQDTVKSAAFDWRQLGTTITIDSLTLIRNDSSESAASILRQQGDQARQSMENQVGVAIFSDAVTNTKMLDGLQGAVDNGSVAATYGGLGSRTTTNSFWQPATGALDTTTVVLTFGAMQTVFGACTEGARHPTILVGTQSNYNRYWALNQVIQRFPSEPMGQDEQLAKAGFTNLLFNNVPFAVDSHCNTTRLGTTGDHLYFLNEDYFEFIVAGREDFEFGEFIEPVNQNVMSQKVKLTGLLACSNPARQGLMSAITS